MRRLALLAALAIASPAMAQGLQFDTTPLGNGFESHTGTAPDGRSITGTTTPLGNGWSTTTWQDNRGHQSTCTNTPLGNGFYSTTCN